MIVNTHQSAMYAMETDLAIEYAFYLHCRMDSASSSIHNQGQIVVEVASQLPSEESQKCSLMPVRAGI